MAGADGVRPRVRDERPPRGATRGGATRGGAMRGGAMRGGATHPELDLRVQDPAALEEIELYSELIIVAGESARPLTRAQIDRALGVRRAPGRS